MEVAEVHDRMHLKTTHYAYAKHAEALGEYPAAISRLERDGCVYLWGFVLVYSSGCKIFSSGCKFFISGKFFSSTENLYYDMYVYSIMKSGH